PGWQIYLDANNNSTLDEGEFSTVTDQYGYYYFTGLDAGTYNVREVSQSGWTQTLPTVPDKYVTVAYAGTNTFGLDFGNQSTNVAPVANDDEFSGSHDTGITGNVL